jgi:hypothetical protein
MIFLDLYMERKGKVRIDMEKKVREIQRKKIPDKAWKFNVIQGKE